MTPGHDHTCGLTTAGVAYCWGRNAFGVLGDGAVGNGRSSPAAVVGGLTFAKLTVGDFHACGLTAAGAAHCWGWNASGQLGDGTDLAQSAGRSSPVAVVGELIFATISAGAAHSCGVTSAGAAYCWGSNRAGQLGDGTTTNRSTPTLVGGGVSFTAISARGSHTCALTPTGAAYCWGSNQKGELGDETTTSRLTPTPLAGGLTFSSVSAGFNHTVESSRRASLTAGARMITANSATAVPRTGLVPCGWLKDPNPQASRLASEGPTH